MKAETKKTAKNAAISLLIALVGFVGLEKLMELVAGQGKMAEKIGSLAVMAAGFGLQFTESSIAKVAGILAMAKGSTSAIKSFITSETGAVKPDAVSSTLAKAIMPQTGLSGLRRKRSLRGLGTLNLPMTTQAAPQVAVPQTNLIAAMTP